MRGMSILRAAALGVTLIGVSLSVQAQTPTPATKPAPTTTPTPTTTTAPSTPVVSPTAVAATVNGHPIHESVVQRALERVPPAKRAEVRPGLIDHLVNNLLIDLALKHAGYKVEKADVDKRIGDMKAELKKVGRDFDKMLGELKVAENELREHIEADLRWFKYGSAQATDKALTEMFTGNKEMFDGTTVKAQHVLITPKDKDAKTAEAATALLKQIKAAVESETNAGLAKLPTTADNLAREKERQKLMSESFAKYAKEKSDCPSKQKGGEVGPFPKIGIMVAPFANAAFALQPYQMTDVVQTPFGYHLILSVEKKAGREMKFEDAKDLVKEVYFDRLHESLAANLRSQAKIIVNPAPK